MINSISEAESLKGILLRPEGLHLCMNICKYIMEVFHSRASVGELATLGQLQVMIDRKDLKLDMTTGYNACRNYVNDVLDGHIVAAGMNVFGMENVNDEPTKAKPSPLLKVAGPDRQQE